MKHDITHLIETSRPTLTPEERSVLWSRIKPELASSPIVSPFTLWFGAHQRVALALIAVLIVLGGGVSTVLAENARPGDVLFPLDRAIERLELRLAQTESDRGRIGVRHAEERIAELRGLLGDAPTTEPLSTGTTTSYVHVTAAVEALVRAMDESNMSETAREHVYQNLFIEIDPLSVDVRVGDSKNEDESRERIQIERDSRGKTKIEIREGARRTRIEKKDGEVRIEYRDENQDGAEEEEGGDKDDGEDGEVESDDEDEAEGDDED